MDARRAKSEINNIIGSSRLALKLGQRSLMDADYPEATRALKHAAFLHGHANGMLHAMGRDINTYDSLGDRLRRLERDVQRFEERLTAEDDD